jgi:large subunit ribosomal protein L6e
VDLAGVDDSVVKKASESGYFTKDKESKKSGEDAFFKQGEKPEVSITHPEGLATESAKRVQRGISPQCLTLDSLDVLL